MSERFDFEKWAYNAAVSARGFTDEGQVYYGGLCRLKLVVEAAVEIKYPGDPETFPHSTGADRVCYECGMPIRGASVIDVCGHELHPAEGFPSGCIAALRTALVVSQASLEVLFEDYDRMRREIGHLHAALKQVGIVDSTSTVPGQGDVARPGVEPNAAND